MKKKLKQLSRLGSRRLHIKTRNLFMVVGFLFYINPLQNSSTALPLPIVIFINGDDVFYSFFYITYNFPLDVLNLMDLKTRSFH